MFEKILDCPQCKKRFHYRHEGKIFPEFISCPECGQSSPYREFDAIVFCGECRTKIKVPLEYFYAEELFCPRCNTPLITEENISTDSAGSTIGMADHLSGRSQRRFLQDGDFFDKYQIIRLLGRGGMAEVYLAEHLLLKQKCALKLMQGGLEQKDPVFVKRFIREAKITHQLEHPNIVRVFDAGSDFKTGCLFIAMEYVEGCTLDTLISENKFSEDDLLEVLRAMTDALSRLEEAHIVHRDIKPSNIMYSYREGIYKLMDLGIAKSESNHQAGEMTLTMDRCSIGTPGYASPEQCNAAHKVDIRSDIYSLGATMYHAASGEMPFNGETPVATIIKMLQTEAEPLKNHRPDLSDAFLDLIGRMMSKDPEGRPQQIAEMQAEIAKVVQLRKRKNGLLKKFQGMFLHFQKCCCPGAWVFSLKSCWKILACITVFLLIIAHIKFIVMYLRDIIELKIPVSYPAYVKSGFGLWEVEQKQEMGSIKSKLEKNHPHPLIVFPDEFSYAPRNVKAEGFTYATVTHNLAELCQEGQKVDLGKTRYWLVQQPEVDKAGVLVAQESAPLQDVRFRIPHSLGRGLTLSVYFKLFSKKAVGLLNVAGNCTWIIGNNTLWLIVGEHLAEIKFSPPVGKWFNLTVSIDYARRKLILLSGDRLLGSYLLQSCPVSSLLFFSLGDEVPFVGMMACLTVIPKSLQCKVADISGKKLQSFDTLPEMPASR